MRVLITLLLVGCTTREIVIRDAEADFADGLWIDESTLQLAVAGPRVPDVPVVFARAESCSMARKLIPDTLHSRYPAARKFPDIKNRITFTIYDGESGCRLMVQYYSANLKEKLKS